MNRLLGLALMVGLSFAAQSDGVAASSLFAPTVSIALPAAEWLEVGDFNRDDRPDLAVAGYEARSGSVLLGRGDGTFVVRRNALRGVSFGLGVADLNRDKKADVVSGEAYSVTTLLGRGDGRFRVGIHSRLPGSIGQPIALADINRDGRLDVFGSNVRPGNIAVALGRGNGKFGAPRRFHVHGGIEYFALADVNGDGRIDVLTANGDDQSISVARGRANGFDQALTYPVPDFPNGIAAADFTGDGHPDLAVVNNFPESGGLAIFRGIGDGSFEPLARYAPGTSLFTVETIDVNQDGLQDLATGALGQGGVTVFVGEGDGRFSEAAAYPLGAVQQIRRADFNLDGKPDLAVAMETRVAVLLNSG